VAHAVVAEQEVQAASAARDRAADAEVRGGRGIEPGGREKVAEQDSQRFARVAQMGRVGDERLRARAKG
jgi:hypothetical protein